MEKTVFFDSNHVRYTLAATKGNSCLNWLFFPGGPGVDSSYFIPLIEIIDVSGNFWLIDLPGNGSNIEGIDDYNFDRWFEIFLPSIKRFEKPILIGHSFGGMFPLLFPELEPLLEGLIIFHSAPSLWLEEAVSYSKQFNLPDFSAEINAFTLNPHITTYKNAVDACMPYYFPKETLEQGRFLMNQIPMQYKPAVWWLRKSLLLNYSAKWIPLQIPTFIIGGKYDCVTPFTLFQKDLRFLRTNITFFHIEEAGHFSWMDSPHIVKTLFQQFFYLIQKK